MCQKHSHVATFTINNILHRRFYHHRGLHLNILGKKHVCAHLKEYLVAGDCVFDVLGGVSDIVVGSDGVADVVPLVHISDGPMEPSSSAQLPGPLQMSDSMDEDRNAVNVCGSFLGEH
ncbi:protein of unknown function (DUF4371) [Popillia japonica]|uniref:Uncharacterized protein n=1 Tax=Popillia japonica TaxID=7064 RepID=A0AAW1L5J4_POPJA